jgi:hypothetical protein
MTGINKENQRRCEKGQGIRGGGFIQTSKENDWHTGENSTYTSIGKMYTHRSIHQIPPLPEENCG